MAKATVTSPAGDSGRPGDDLAQAFLETDLGEEPENEDTGDESEDHEDELEEEPSDDDSDDEDEGKEGGDADEESEESDEDDDDTLSDEGEDDDSDLLDKVGQKLIPIKIDGKEEKVTIAEAAQGYMRTKAFTQKTMEVAEKRKEADQKIHVYGELITRLQSHLDTVLKPEKEPDWDELRRDDPAEYAAKRQDWKDLKEQRDAVEAEQVRLKAARTKEETDAYGKYLDEQEVKLLDALPQWKKNPELAKKEAKVIRNYMLKNGFSEDELKSFADHRAVLLVRKAALYDKRPERMKLKLKESPKVGTLRPKGMKTTPKGAQKVQLRNAEKRLKRSGSVSDLADVFLLSGELDDLK